MAKMDHQFKLISELKQFTGSVSPVYTNQREFFFISLQNISENLIDLKKETLKEACESFGKRLDEGKVTDITIVEFKGLLDKLVSSADLTRICNSIAGSKELIKSRLSTLEPISLIEEERKTKGRDADADRHIGQAYKNLKFDSLIKELKASPYERTTETILEKARAEVKEYCCLYGVPLKEDETLTPLSLEHVDAVIAASYRLISDIRKAMGNGM
jgi:hypothetical protein